MFYALKVDKYVRAPMSVLQLGFSCFFVVVVKALYTKSRSTSTQSCLTLSQNRTSVS